MPPVKYVPGRIEVRAVEYVPEYTMARPYKHYEKKGGVLHVTFNGKRRTVTVTRARAAQARLALLYKETIV